jgi:hypothetical protein
MNASCRLVQLRTGGGASHRRVGGRRARKQACLCGPLSEQDERRRAGHLHSSIRHTQEHRLVLVAAWKWLEAGVISASDHEVAPARNLLSRRRHARPRGGAHHRRPPCTHQWHSSPPPFCTGLLPRGGIACVCNGEAEESDPKRARRPPTVRTTPCRTGRQCIIDDR